MAYIRKTKECINCKKDFTIQPDDFGFYEKIGVPPPTFCPECRYIRRLLDRNEYNFYKRKCDATGEDIISIYREDAPFPVYKQEYWKSDKFEAKNYGRDFDFERPFFEQYEELRREVPHLALVNENSVNSEYTNQSGDNKDCYMQVTSSNCDKCMYGSWGQHSFFCGDCYMAGSSEFCYECVNISKCSKCLYCYDCGDCINTYFSNDLRNCSDCFGCVGLRSKHYYWFNESVGKEEYRKRFESFDWRRESIRDIQEKFRKFRLKFPFKYYHGFQAKNSTGDYMENVERARMLFNCRDNKDTAYMQDAWEKTEDCRDCTEIILGELSYEIQGMDSPVRSIACRSCLGSGVDSYYCDMCFGCHDCLGCFGLKYKKYCILNKQYNKQEYFELKKKIIEHMKGTEEWGEYFPSKFSPFAYNESMAQDYFPLTKEEALSKGYAWYDRPDRDYKITEGVIKCTTQNSESEKEKYPLCTTAFKLTSLELSLYKILGLPSPEKCFSCRRQDRFELRNPRKLWHRTCMCDRNSHFHGAGKCEVEFETSYAPERPEIVYCEKCYQAEIY